MLPYYSSSTFNTVSGDATITSTGVISVVSSSYALTASHALNAGGGGSTSPGGSDGQVQYNNGGSFGGAAQLYYDDGNDRVGIGTASPASLLEVQYTSGTGTIRIDQNEVAQGLYFTGRTGYDDYSIDLANTNGLRFYNRGTSNTELQLRDGKVGIGTTSPGTPLHISRDAGSSTFTRFTREDLTDESWDQRIDAGGTLEIRSVTDAGTTVLNAFQLEHATGNLTLKGWIRSESGSAGDPTYSFSNDTNTGMYLATTDELAFSTAGAGRMRIDPDGNVGIGYTTPKTKLHVKGGIAPTSVPAAGATPAESASLLNVGDGYIQAQRNDGTTTTYDLLLNPNGGNVGIGTTDPTASLHVVGVGYFQADGAQFGSADLVTNAAIVIPEDDFIYTEDGTPGSANLRKLIGKSGSADIIQIGQPGTSLIDEIRFYPGTTWDGTRGFTSFYNSTTEVARFTGDGLGIGTTSPDFKLDVIGSGSFEELLRVTRG
jgi:hypothetical protein